MYRDVFWQREGRAQLSRECMFARKARAGDRWSVSVRDVAVMEEKIEVKLIRRFNSHSLSFLHHVAPSHVAFHKTARAFLGTEVFRTNEISRVLFRRSHVEVSPSAS